MLLLAGSVGETTSAFAAPEASQPKETRGGEARTTAKAAAKSPSHHFDIDDFAVRGAEHLSQEEVEEAIYPFLGPDKTEEDVEKARKALEAAYHDKGFQTVSVSIPAQNVGNKVVVLKVTELKIGRLRVKNSRYFDANKIKRDAPSLAEGTVPNFNAVSKDIVSLNQWPDRKVTPALRAGVTPGTVDVDLNVDDTLPVHGSLELNNRQSPETAPLRVVGTVSYNNLWQLGHSVSFTYQVAPQDPSNAEVFSGSYLARIPHVDWASVLVYGVDSNSNVAAVGGTNIIGPGQIIGARAVITLPSRPNFFHTISFGADYKSFGETVSLSGNSFSSPVTYYPLVANYTAKYQTDQFATQLTASVTDNLRPFSSDWTAFDNRRYDASPSFAHVNFDLQHTQELPKAFDGIELYGRVQGQLSDGPLVSSEQMGIGGLDTVRGYLEAETLADNGIAGTFEVRSPDLSGLLNKELTPQKSAAVASATGSASKSAGAAAAASPDDPFAHLPVFNELRFFGFTDRGYAQVLDPLPEQQSTFDLWSTGIGARFKMFNYLNGVVDASVPLISQTYTQAYNPRVDFRIWGEF